jgi:hypothetical protein
MSIHSLISNLSEEPVSLGTVHGDLLGLINTLQQLQQTVTVLEENVSMVSTSVHGIVLSIGQLITLQSTVVNVIGQVGGLASNSVRIGTDISLVQDQQQNLLEELNVLLRENVDVLTRIGHFLDDEIQLRNRQMRCGCWCMN